MNKSMQSAGKMQQGCYGIKETKVVPLYSEYPGNS